MTQNKIPPGASVYCCRTCGFSYQGCPGPKCPLIIEEPDVCLDAKCILAHTTSVLGCFSHSSIAALKEMLESLQQEFDEIIIKPCCVWCTGFGHTCHPRNWRVCDNYSPDMMRVNRRKQKRLEQQKHDAAIRDKAIDDVCARIEENGYAIPGWGHIVEQVRSLEDSASNKSTDNNGG